MINGYEVTVNTLMIVGSIILALLVFVIYIRKVMGGIKEDAGTEAQWKAEVSLTLRFLAEDVTEIKDSVKEYQKSTSDAIAKLKTRVATLEREMELFKTTTRSIYEPIIDSQNRR